LVAHARGEGSSPQRLGWPTVRPLLDGLRAQVLREAGDRPILATYIPPPNWARNTGAVVSRASSGVVLVNASVANSWGIGHQRPAEHPDGQRPPSGRNVVADHRVTVHCRTAWAARSSAYGSREHDAASEDRMVVLLPRCS
jgi:hypothetical protein